MFMSAQNRGIRNHKPAQSPVYTGNGTPCQVRMLYREALDLAEKGDHVRALRILEQAVTIAPGFVPAYQEIGNCNLRLGRFWEAVNSYDRALSIFKETGDASGLIQDEEFLRISRVWVSPQPLLSNRTCLRKNTAE